MKPLILLLASALLAAPSAFAGEPPEGSWVCAPDTPGAGLKLEVTYAADGTIAGKGDVAPGPQDPTARLKFHYKGTWQRSGDQLLEVLLNPTVTEAVLKGKELPEQQKAMLLYGMTQPSSTTIRMDGEVMTLVGAGSNMVCRKAETAQ
jgi:hypothetical protein